MKHLTALLILLLACAGAQTVRAQAADSWVNVAPTGEQFTIQMPTAPAVKSQQNSFNQLKVEARIYTANSDGVDYTVWSLVNEGYAKNTPLDSESYVDACVDLVWDSLLKPLRDEVPKAETPKFPSYMAYQRELEPRTLPPGREYTIKLGRSPGVTHIYVAGQRIYVLTVLNADPGSSVTLHFLNSFSLIIPELPIVVLQDPELVPPSARGGNEVGGGLGRGVSGGDRNGVGTGQGIGPGLGRDPNAGDRNVGGGGPATGPGDSTDYNRIFSPREVTQKARVLSKPEPTYTESARRYSVQGTVVIRAVFSRSGQVTNMNVVRGLPHGLIQRALGAARQIRFAPALKDGHEVSMYIQLEYNFNLY